MNVLSAQLCWKIVRREVNRLSSRRLRRRQADEIETLKRDLAAEKKATFEEEFTGRIYSFIGPIYCLPFFASIGKKWRKNKKISILARIFSPINYLLIDISEIEIKVWKWIQIFMYENHLGLTASGTSGLNKKLQLYLHVLFTRQPEGWTHQWLLMHYIFRFLNNSFENWCIFYIGKPFK